jgi:hypothetical protein
VATNFTFLQSNPRGNRGLDFVSLMSKLWDMLWEPARSPMQMYPDEAAEVLRYQARRDRLRMPHPLEGEAEHARVCFFLRKYTDKQEFWSIDTDSKEITRLAFFAKWEGQDKHFDLEIGTPKG